MTKKDYLFSIIIKSMGIILSIYGIIMNSHNLINFTFFTILSNIFAIVMLFIYLIKDILNMKGKKTILNEKVYIIKFLSVISITLTFVVFMFVLAPTLEGGFIKAYLGTDGSSLCLHFIVPMLCILDFILFDNEYKLKGKHIMYSTIPPLIYVVFVYILSLFGVRWFGMTAPYNFLNYSSEIGWFGFDLDKMSWNTFGIGTFYMIIILIIIFIPIGRLLIFIKNKINEKR